MTPDQLARFVAAARMYRNAAEVPLARSVEARLYDLVVVVDSIILESFDGATTVDFLESVKREAAFQRAKWGSDSDAGKTAADWYWLIGFLAGKALTAALAGNTEKALHHTISTAAALANWHAALSGADTRMRPGHEHGVGV